MKIRTRRGVLAVLGGLGLAVTVASPASADPPGPTDYLSVVVSVEPPTPTIAVDIIGGDSFFELKVQPAVEAMVIGYQGEDYLWFKPDGEVFENRNSPAAYINASRYGGQDVPATAAADADPDWKQVASGGYWVWHDHRAHWMQSARPFGLSPGDQILEAVIPIVVDGTTVEVTVASTWQPEPSPIPMWLGVLVGVGVAVGAWMLRRSRGAALAVTLPVALLALVLGAVQYSSLPAETGPRPVWFALPLIATLSAAVGVVLARRGNQFAADAALLIVGVELAIWGFLKRDGLSAAIIPTNAPNSLDRFATALALVGGVGVVVVAAWLLFNAAQAPTRSGRVVDEPAVT